MLKLEHPKLAKQQTDFVNTSKLIINKILYEDNNIPQRSNYWYYLDRTKIGDANKVTETITKYSPIQTPLIIDPEISRLENQKYQPKDLEQHIQELDDLTSFALLKRNRRSDSSDEDNQQLKNVKLFEAIRKKQSEKTIIEEINRCLDDGAEINARNTKGKTVLHIAVEKNYKDIIEFLLKQGAKINILNDNQKTPLDLAESNQHIVQILTKSINVPGDGSCLFWAVTLAYLTPVKNDHRLLFQERFNKLFGSENLQYLSEVQTLIQHYNPFIKQEKSLNNKILKELITKFRGKVVDYMRSNPTDFKESAEGEMGTTFEQYLDQMSRPGKWGGEPEISTMSKMLGRSIQVDGAITTAYQEGPDPIKLYHEVLTGDTSSSSSRNHYNFGVDLDIVDDYPRSVSSHTGSEKQQVETIVDSSDQRATPPKRKSTDNDEDGTPNKKNKFDTRKMAHDNENPNDNDIVSAKRQFLDKLEIPSEGSKLAQHGNIFQLKLLMLFLWRAKKNDYTAFRLATELSEAEKFDDVAFQYQQSNGDKWKFRLLQAKHKEGATAETELSKIKKTDLLSTDDDEAFSLQKYFRSYLKIKQRSKESSIYSVFSESEIEDIIVITNTDFDSDRLENNFEVDREKDIEADELLKVGKDHNTKWQEALVYKLKDQENNAIVRKLKPIFKNTSDFYKLVEELAEHILMEKQIDKTGLFKDYYYPLISEVFKIEKKEGKSEYYLEFLSKFINEDALSKETTEFRNALIKEITFIQNNQGLITISEEFGKNELPSDDSKLKELAKKLADCVEQKQELIVSNFEDYHVALATEVINPETKKFRSSFINPKKDINKNKLRDFFKTEIAKKIRQIKKITNDQLKSIEFTVSRDFGESKLPNNDSKLEKLAETLANAIKDTEELKPSLSEEFKNYHVVLAKEVIDINTKKFREIFIHGKVKEGNNIKQLSTLSKKFRRILLDKMVNADQVQSTKDSLKAKKIKVSKGFMEEFKSVNTPEIQDVQEFAKQIKELLSKSINEKKVVEINENSVAKEKFNIFKANIKKLAGYVLIEKFNKVRFSTSFLYSDELPGSLKNFRDKLKSSLGQGAFELIYEYEFNIKVKGFKTCEDGELYRKLPVIHSDGDVNDFFSKLKFVVNYPNRIGVNDLLEGEIQNKLKKLDSKAFNSLYQEELHNWMADRVGAFYTVDKAKILFQQIENNLSLWTIDGFNKPYFANASKKYKFQEYTVLNEFLSKNIQQVLHLVFEDLALGRTRIVQTFEQLQKGDSANIQKYTRDFGHIFLYLDQLDDPNFRSKVYEVLKYPSKFNLIVIECNTQKKIEGLYNNLSQHRNNKKIIFITDQKNDALASEFAEEKELRVDGSSFNDLETDSQKKFLKEEAITFQGGEEKTSLEKLIEIKDLDNYLSQKENQDRLNNIMNSKTLVKFIKNEEINIGHNLPISKGYDEDYYVSRKLNEQIILNKNKIQNDIKNRKIKSDFFVISGTDSELEGYNKIYVFDKNNDKLADGKFRELCVQNTGSNIHWLKSESGKIIWHQSEGSISNLVKYREIDKVDRTDDKTSKKGLPEKKYLEKNTSKIVIIADTAGMGKSTVLTSLSVKIKKDNPSLWVIRIDLNDYTTVLSKELANRKSKKQGFSNQDINTAVNFLLNDLLESQKQSKLTTKLEQELFKNSFNGQGKIALLFDGFDEISPDYQDVVIDILQVLKNSKVEKLFVTTRPNMRELLEERLEVFSHVLEPFSKEDQIKFFTKFWTKKLELKDLNQEYKERLDTYAKSLIKKFSTSINDKVQTFIGIPLQTRMLAEIFQSNQEGQQEEQQEAWQGCKEFIDLDNTNEEPKLPEQFDLLDLYERFVKRKFYYIHLKEKKARDFSKTGAKRLADENYEDFNKRHKILALHRLFSDEDVEKLLSEEEIQKLNSWIKDIKSAEQNEGIIDQIIDNKAHFVHRTFAEYFTANFLSIRQNQQHEKAIQELVLTKILIKSDYKVIRTFLYEYHKEEKLDQVLWNKEMLDLLNIAYSYDDSTDDSNLLEKMIKQDNESHISFLFDVLKKQQSYEHTVNELITDSCYITALDNDYIEIIDILFENVDNKRLALLLHQYNDCSLLGKFARDSEYDFNFVALAKTRLTDVQIKDLFDDPDAWDSLQEGNFEFIEMLESLLDRDSVRAILQRYSEEVTQALGQNRGHKDPDPEWYRIEITYLENDYEEHEQGYDYDIDDRISEGQGSEALELLSSASDSSCSSGSNSLHSRKKRAIWSCIDREEESGKQKIVKSGNWHEVVKWLIEEKSANIAATDEFGRTILHKAAEFGRLDLVKWLVEEQGADVNTPDKYDTSLLHFATASGNLALVKWLIEEKHLAIDAQDKFGKSALHFAALYNYQDIIALLVAKNADINLRDRNGETALEIARKEQHQEIIKQLQKASIELENKQYIEISLDNLTELQEEQREIGLEPSGSVSSTFGCNAQYRMKRHIGSCQEGESDDVLYEPLEESVSVEQARASKIYSQISMAVILKHADQFLSSNNNPLDYILTYNKYIGEIISEQKANNSPREQRILADHYQQAQQFLKDYPETKLLKKIARNSGEVVNIDDNQSWLFDNGQQSMLVFKEGKHYGLYSQDFNYRQKFQTREDLIFKQLEGFIKAFFKWHSGSSKYQTFILADTMPQKFIEQLKLAKFWQVEQVAPDHVLLNEQHLGLIESIPASVIRKLFLLHGQSPDIAGLHVDFFAHNKNDISCRFEVLHEVLQSLNVEQRQALMAVIKKYNIAIDRTYLDTLSGDEKSLLELYYNKVTNKLKTDVTITPQLLSELSWESLSDGIANHPDISHELANKIVNSNKQVHEAASKGAVLKGMATQVLFFLPDIIRAANSGDISNLEQTGAMIAGDAAINHLYGALVNKLATIMPAGRAELLSKLPVTSPIFKALTIYSIVELHKKLENLPTNSEERSIIKHKLGEQYVTAGLMVAELLGFEVTPLWIGLIAEQLIFDATSFRKQNHLDIPFWEALAMSLGFEQDKLQNILEERQLVEMNLALVNQINNQTQIPYGLTIVKIPKLGKLKWQNITQYQVPDDIRYKIDNIQDFSPVVSPYQILEENGFRRVDKYELNAYQAYSETFLNRGKLISSIWQKASYDAYPQKSKLAFALHHNNMNSFKHEDNIFLDQLLVNNVNYQRIPSKATGIFLNGQDVLKRSEVEAAVYLNTEAYRHANAQSNFYVGFDPREGDIALEFTSQGLERIDTMNVMRYFAAKNIAMHNSLNNTSPYMITVQVASKPYPDSLEFAKDNKGEFSVQDNSQRIISQYVINDDIDYVIKDFTSATRISFIANLAQQEMCTTIRSEPNTIFILKWQCDNKIVNGRNQIEYLNLIDISGRILISDNKKYLQLVLNNHVIDSHLRVSAEHVDIIEAKGRLDKNSKIDLMQAVNSFNVTLRGDIIVSDQATYLQMSGKVASILPAIIYAKSAHNKVIALYEFNLDNLQPILESMLRSNNSEFMDIKFSSNDVQYHWHNKLPINNTLQLAGRLDGKRGLLQIEPKSDILQIFNDDNSIATTQIAHYDTSAVLEDGLILQKVFRTIEPNVTDITNSELVTNTDNGNMLEFNIAGYYGQADVLEFQAPAGYLLYHYFPINRIIKLNNINYIVKNQMICASSAGQTIINGYDLIKYAAISNLGNIEQMVGICFPQLLAASKILVKNDTLRINDLTLKSLEDSTKLYFSETEILSVKTLKDSLAKNQISNVTASSTKHIEKQNIVEHAGQEYLVNLNNSSRTINYNQLNKATIILNNIKTVKTGELKVTVNNNDLLFVASSSNHTLRIKNWPSDEMNNSDNRIVTLKFEQLSPAIEIRAINKLKLSEIAKIQNLVSKAELSYEITKQLEQLDAKMINDLKYLLVSNHKVGLTGNNHCLGFKSPLEQQEFISSYGKNYNQEQLQEILDHHQIIKALTWLIAKDYNDLSLQEPSQEKTELITAISKCYKEVISGKIIHRLLKHLEEGHAITKIERFIEHHEQELKQKITAEFKASKVTSSAFITESITEILDSEAPQHVRSRRAIDAQNEHDEQKIENISDHVITSTASSMPSPMNNMINWLKTNVVGVLLSNVLNPVNKINWFTAENIKSSSIDATQIADSRTNNTAENSASIKSVDYGQFNLNDSLTLADLIIRKITKVKPYITTEEPLNLLEVQAQVLNIIAGFEEILEKYSPEKDILMAELEFDPITLQKQLISEIVNGNHSNIVKILSKSIEKTQLTTKATELKDHLQDEITAMLEKQQDMLLANEPLINNRQNNQFNNQSKIENADILYNIVEIENYANVTTNCQPDIGLIG